MKNAPQSAQSYSRQDKPTVEQLADQFAAQALKSALAPTPDGLDVLTELAMKTKTDRLKLLSEAWPMDEPDILRTVEEIVEQFGDQAPAYCAWKIVDTTQFGDVTRVKTWLAIRDKVKSLLNAPTHRRGPSL